MNHYLTVVVHTIVHHAWHFLAVVGVVALGIWTTANYCASSNII